MIERLVAALFPPSADHGIDWRADAIALWQLQRREAPGTKTRLLLDLQIVGHAVHERARRRWRNAGKVPGMFTRPLMAAGCFIESAVGISGPVDDPREERRAVEAVERLGVTRNQARSVVRRYLRRVRAAAAPVGDVSIAGFMAAAVLALGFLGAVATLSLTLALVVGWGQIDNPYYVTDGRSVAEVRDAALNVGSGQTTSITSMAVVVAVVVAAFGSVAGRAERYHSRRTGAHRTFLDRMTDRAYGVEIALLTTLFVMAAAAAALLAYGGNALVLVLAVIAPGALLGVAAARPVFAPIFDWTLRHVSRLDASAYARPLVERDIGLEIVAEGQFYRRGTFNPGGPSSNAAASLWAAKTLEAMGIDPRTRRTALQRRIERKTAEVGNYGLSRRELARYAGGGAGIAVAVWLLVRYVAWRDFEIDFVPFQQAAVLDAIALASGTTIAAALGWLHRRHLAVG